MRLSIILWSVASLLLVCACEEEINDRAEISLSGSSKDIPADGGSFTLNVDSRGSWVLTSTADWVSFSPAQGEGQMAVNVTVAPAKPGAPRKGTIKLASATASDNIEVSQQAQTLVAGRLEAPRLSGKDSTYFLDHDAIHDGKPVDNYCMEYCGPKRHSRWVAFAVYDGTREKNLNRPIVDPWADDPQIAKEYHITKSDFGDYQRGHLCASNDRQFCREANEQTFYYTNMSPQLGAFNTGVWGKLESQVQNKWMRTDGFSDTLYIVKGGTIADDQIIEKIGDGGKLVVPKYYFMAILSVKGGQYQAIGFFLEHKGDYADYALKDFALSIDQLEEKTGIDFYPNLADDIETAVEATCVPAEWGL